MRALVMAAVCVAVAGCVTAGDDASGAAESGAGLRPDLLVTSDWLAARLEHPGVVVLHVASDRGGYDDGHIPGARFLPVRSILVEEGGNPNQLPAVAQLDSVFESVGVSTDSRVILYGAPLAAARAFFTLDYLGHGNRTALLDGGLPGWQAENRSVASYSEAVIHPRGNFEPRPRSERVVDAEWVFHRLGAPTVALLDARPKAQFTGAEAGADVARPGHIPGAVNIFWEEMIQSPDRPTLHDPATLRAMFREAGIQPGDTVVAYCRTGIQSSFAYFVARYLGYETVMYDGSFLDWSRRAELPVER